MGDDPDMGTQVVKSSGLRASAYALRGSLRQRVVIDDGRHVLVTDEPEELGGDDAGPAPHELLPAALAACVATTVQMYARTRAWDIGEVRVDVDYDHRSTPRRFEVALHLDPALSRERVERLARVAASCPVRRAIESGIVFDEEILLDAPGGLPA